MLWLSMKFYTLEIKYPYGMHMLFTYYMSNADRRTVMMQGALLLLQIIVTYTNDIPETCQVAKTRKEKKEKC